MRRTRLVASNLMRSHNPVGVQPGIYKRMQRMEIFSVFGMNSLACQGFWSQTLRCPIPSASLAGTSTGGQGGLEHAV